MSVIVCWCQYLTSQVGLTGAGIVGVVEADFLDPIHNKQEFDKTDRYKYNVTCDLFVKQLCKMSV